MTPIEQKPKTHTQMRRVGHPADLKIGHYKGIEQGHGTKVRNEGAE